MVDVLAFTERWLPGLREQAAYVEVCRSRRPHLEAQHAPAYVLMAAELSSHLCADLCAGGHATYLGEVHGLEGGGHLWSAACW